MIPTLLGGPSPETQNLLLGTVTTGTTSSTCKVLLDGAATSIVAILSAEVLPYLPNSSAIGARVLGVRVGGRFYVTDVISTPAPTTATFSAAGSFVYLSPSTIWTGDIPAGVIWGSLSFSGFSSTAATLGTATVWFDSTSGANTGSVYYFNEANSHRTFPTIFYRFTVASAGSHSLLFGLTISSDSNDHVYGDVHWSRA